MAMEKWFKPQERGYQGQGWWIAGAPKLLMPLWVGPWKYMSKLRQKHSQNVQFKAGNAHILFWKDKWLSNSTLMVKFPTLFQIAQDKESSIADNESGNSWDIHLRKDVQNWELGSLLYMVVRVEKYNIVENLPNTLRLGNKNNFTIKECYRLIRFLITGHGSWFGRPTPNQGYSLQLDWLEGS